MNNAAVFTSEFSRVFKFFLQELKPRGKWLTPFNVISIPVIILGLVILYFRFTIGLGAVTNLNQDFPWGLWIGFDVVTGVAFAGGSYVVTFVVYVMRMDKYHSIVRVTVLNGLLAYIFYAGALVLDLGRPWHIVNPIIGNSFGYNSVLFLVSWHFLLYMITMAVEFSPVVAEWARLEKVRKFLNALTLGAVIFGITLSILHQSGLGALFLMAKPKIHPLWWSEFIPVMFFVSSIYAGLAMIIFEGTISHKVFKDLIGNQNHRRYEDIVLGLAKGAAITMFVYYFFQALLFIHEERWVLIKDFWGYWYLVEVIGFVLVPCFMFAYAVRNRNLGIIKAAAVMALLGIILNRLNVSVIAFRWYAPDHYYPSWQEFIVTLMVVFTEIWVFRWIVTRMPVFKH
ncbi:MAG TPA: NrfD/PsrC family molybdoenzyme membrane anchor subunit [Nitrospiraceae bacterium]